MKSKLHFNRIELHLTASPTFTYRYGKQVRDCGGEYSHIRGSRSTRFVTVPVEETSLIADLLTAYSGSRRTCIVSRGYPEIRNADAVTYVRPCTEGHLPFDEEEVTQVLEELSRRADPAIEAHRAEAERLEIERRKTQRAEAEAWEDFLDLPAVQIRAHLDKGTVLRIMETHMEVMGMVASLNQKGSSE